MAHEWQHSHVPKFGNWDSDNIPYTVYFDSARNKKSFINPNDPEQNPEAFNLYIRGVGKSDEALKVSSLEQRIHEEGRSNTKSHSQHMSVAESGSERSNSDYSVIQRVKSDFIGSLSSSNHIKGRGGSHSLNENLNHEATLVPEFGAWDVTDPKSGEGYTAIFSEIRKEKQIASARMPGKTPSQNNSSKFQNQCGRPSSILSKCCCCLFSSESQ